MHLKRILAAAVLGGASMVASADVIGPAADYGVFIFGGGNFASQNTDSGGNIAAGGNVNLENYSVASAISGNSSLSPNPARLVVGGNLAATNGGVGNGQGGAIYVGGTSSLTSFTATGGTFGQTLVDFASAATLYQGLSTAWSGIAANGTSNLQFGTLTLTGSDSSLNVFSLTAADLTSSNTVNINAPGGSTVLINVIGTSATFQNGQVFLGSGLTPAYVMYNFVDATSVNLAGSKDPQGSILAPLAGVVGGYGAMHGQLITGSYGGTGGDPFGHTEFYDVSFEGSIPTVPVPAAAWLLLSGLGAAGTLVRRRQSPSAV